MKKIKILLCFIAICTLSISSLNATGRCIKTGVKNGHCWTIEFTQNGVTWDELSCGGYNDDFPADCVREDIEPH